MVSNNFGDLADGTTTRRPQPVQIGTATNWQTIASGQQHALALRTDGSLWAAGFNSNGQVGDGTGSQKISFVQLGASTWTVISGGQNHSAAIRSDGTLWAWGLNTNGQLGDSTTTQRTAPVQIGLATTWAAVSGGANHSLARQTDGTLWSWGRNSDGQLGLGDTTNRSAPLKIGTSTNWTSLHAASTHSLALQADGTLWTFGNNSNTQLGDLTSTRRTIPIRIGNLTTWTRLANGPSFFSLAATADGSLWGFGTNGDYQISSNARVESLLELAHPGIGTQTITTPAVQITSFGVPVPLTGTSSSGLPVSYAVSGPASISSGQLTVTGPGVVKLIAWQAGQRPAWMSTSPTEVPVIVPPLAITLPTSALTSTAVTLNGSGNANSLSTTFVFEYDTDISDLSYANSIAATPGVLTGLTTTAVSASLANLPPATLYHYRLRASNAAGTAFGTDGTFTTLTPFAEWLAANSIPGPNADPEDDADGDGIANLLEAALNMNGNAGSQHQLPSSGSAVNPGDGERYLTYSFRRRIAPGTLQYILESSTDLTTWDIIPGLNLEQLSATPTGDGVTELITIRVSPSIDDSPTPRFIHLKVTVTP
jgi:hypothetical protein